MREALNYDILLQQVQDLYKHDRQRIVAIMMARYNVEGIKEIIDKNYNYWNLNTGTQLDIFLPGYGEYLYERCQNSKKQLLTFPDNKNNVYFDLDAFTNVKKELNKHFKKPTRDKLELVLVDYRDGQLRLESSFKIDLEAKNLNPAQVREKVERITNHCIGAQDIRDVMMHLKWEQMIDLIKEKKIELSREIFKLAFELWLKTQGI